MGTDESKKKTLKDITLGPWELHGDQWMRSVPQWMRSAPNEDGKLVAVVFAYPKSREWQIDLEPLWYVADGAECTAEGYCPTWLDPRAAADVVAVAYGLKLEGGVPA